MAEELPYVTLFTPASIEGYRNDTFEGWFGQLDGIASSIPYITPVMVLEETPPPTEEPGGLCLGTLFVALVVLGGSAVYFKRRN